MYFAKYADINTSYIVQINTNKVLKSLQEISKLLIKWFKDNKMKLHPD